MTTSASVNGTQNFTFGAVSIVIRADGDDIDRPTEMLDHMLSTATTITSVEIVNSGISSKKRDDSSAATHEQYSTSTAFGNGISLNIEIKIDAAGHLSKQTLNSIVFGGILPKTIQTAAIYFGDNQTRTSPPAPLPSRPRREVYDNVEEALALIDRGSLASASSGRPDSYQSDQDNSR